MIQLDPAARAHVLAHGGALHLHRTRVVQGGCGVGPMEERPAVRLGPPPEGERAWYEAAAVEGVTVHLPRSLVPADVLRVRLVSVLGWKRLVVEGWNPIALTLGC